MTCWARAGIGKRKPFRRNARSARAFRFLGRADLCDRHLTMSRSRDPLSKRELPEITMLDFPERLGQAIEEIERNLGLDYGLLLKLKVISQARTGERKTDKGIFGIRKGSGSLSYLIMNERETRFRLHEKGNEDWDITWIPKSVRDDLYTLYQRKQDGELIFSRDMRRTL